VSSSESKNDSQNTLSVSSKLDNKISENKSESSNTSIISYLTETVIHNKKKESKIVKEKTEDHFEENIYKLDKYNLNSVDLYNKHILIINEYKKDNVEILNNVLYKLNLLKNISNIYANNIHIITSDENKKLYKKILLDNPYLYFINFDFKKVITKDFVERCDNTLQKRTVVIIDTYALQPNIELTNRLQENKNIQLILLSNLKNMEIINLYKLIAGNKLLIHKINKLKSIQKQFYELLNPICKTAFDNFDDFYNSLNNETLDVKYIILKNLELKYN
jgi:hypothetical protein